MVKHGRVELIKRKMRSLVIPFGLWTVLSIPVGGNPDLWYLQSLVLFTFVIIAFWSFGLDPLRMPVAIGIVALFGAAILLGWGWFYGTPTSPFYFLGGFVCSRLMLADHGRPRFGILVVVICCAFVGRLFWIELFPNLSALAEMILRNVCVVLLGLSIWLLLRALPQKDLPKSAWLRVTFFVYCIHHHFILDWITPLWRWAFSGFSHQDVIGLFVVASLTMFLSCIAALAIRKWMPKCYELLSGGR